MGTNIIGSDPDATTNITNTLRYGGFGGIRTLKYGSYTNPRKLDVTWDLRRQQAARMKVLRDDGTDLIVDQEYDYYNGGNGRSNGRMQKITDNLDSAYTTTYTYDDYQRLTNASATAYTRAYSYDAWANQTGVTVTGPSETGSYSMSYATNASGAPATNRIWQYVGVTALGYDNAGNQTFDGWQNHTYDAASRLKTALNASSSYEYDGDGGRVKQTNSGGTIYYLRSSVLGDVVAEINGGSSTLYRAYVRSSIGQALAVQSYYGDFYWIHSDHLGSAKKHTDSSGNVTYSGQFDPYGQAVSEWQQYSETYKHSRKFTGYERDWATNLDYANARTYDFRRARFMQPDPLGLGASDLTAPQSLNLYAYVGNDPVNAIDPTGLDEFPIYYVTINGQTVAVTAVNGGTISGGGGGSLLGGGIDLFGGIVTVDAGGGDGGGGGGGGGGGTDDGGMTPGQKNHCDRLAEAISAVIDGFQSGATWVKGLATRLAEQVGASANHGPGMKDANGKDWWDGHRQQINGRRDVLKNLLDKWDKSNCGPRPPGATELWANSANPVLEAGWRKLNLPPPSATRGAVTTAGTVAAGGIAAYATYRILRLLPSLLVPPTIIPNLLIP